jgi:hypothetical protein
LGDIESDRFYLNNGLVPAIIERMNIYVNDYVISEFEQALRVRKVDPSKYDLKEMYLLCKGFGVEDDEVSYTMAELVLNPDTIFVPELYSSRVKENEISRPSGISQHFVIKRENVGPSAAALLTSDQCYESSSEKSRLLELISEGIHEENQTILDDLFLSNGYCIDFDRQGGVYDLHTLIDGQENDLKFFAVIAPFVDKGIWLNLSDDNGNMCKISFDGKQSDIEIEYKAWSIFERDGAYTVGGVSQTSFEECTLECLPTIVDETEMVEFCRNNNFNLSFVNLHGIGEEVPYEKYQEHLAKYQLLANDDFTNEEYIVPLALFNSVEQAKQFVDWLEVREDEIRSKRSLDEKITSAEKTAHENNEEQGSVDRSPREEYKL